MYTYNIAQRADEESDVDSDVRAGIADGPDIRIVIFKQVFIETWLSIVACGIWRTIDLIQMKIDLIQMKIDFIQMEMILSRWKLILSR